MSLSFYSFSIQPETSPSYLFSSLMTCCLISSSVGIVRYDQFIQMFLLLYFYISYMNKMELEKKCPYQQQQIDRKVRRRSLRQIQQKMLFGGIKIAQFDLEIFRNSHLFHNSNFCKLFNQLQKWNQLVLSISNENISHTQQEHQIIKKQKHVYQKIYEQLSLIKNKPLSFAQYQLSKFSKLFLISKIINTKTFSETKMPPKKKLLRPNSLEQFLINKEINKCQRSQSHNKFKTKDNQQFNFNNRFNDFYREQVQRLRTCIEHRQMDDMIQNSLKNKARLACERIKMRKSQPINSLVLQYGVSKYPRVEQKEQNNMTRNQSGDSEEKKSLLDQNIIANIKNIRERKSLKKANRANRVKSQINMVRKRSKGQKQKRISVDKIIL